MNAFSEFVYKISKGWVVVLGFVLFLVFSLLTLPGQNAKADAYSGGAGSPDTSLFYTGDQLYQMANEYGDSGRQVYLRARWTFDLAFPLVYTAFLLTSASWLLKRGLEIGSRWHMLNLIPVGAMLLDFLENTATSLVFARFPVHCPAGELLAPVFTPLKWLFVAAAFLLVFLGVGLIINKALKRANK